MPLINSKTYIKKPVQKLIWCKEDRGRIKNAGHWFNKHNICTLCGNKYEDLLSSEPTADGKLVD